MTVRRIVFGILLIALLPLAAELPALAALGLLTAIMVTMIATEAMRYPELREQVRHEDAGPEVHDPRRADSPAPGR